MSQTAENCTHNCETCGANCASRQKESLLEAPNPGSHIQRVVAVVSGKGGVGKSLVTGLSAVRAMREGKRVGVLDADITGPSIPKMFGVENEEIMSTEAGLLPAETENGIRILSMNLLLEDPSSPVVWRAPIISGAVKQFWTDVVWGDLDELYVDMPPGTGDVPLTVFQSLPVDGIIIVTTPQELVEMIVAKAVNMARMMNVPILGIVENMSYLKCPCCGEELHIFGKSRLDEIAARYELEILGRIPMDPAFAAACDAGQIENVEMPF